MKTYPRATIVWGCYVQNILWVIVAKKIIIEEDNLGNWPTGRERERGPRG